jgi:hypothetical protein
MTLKQYITKLKKVLKDNPEYGELPVVYVRDDEGNGYQMIHQPAIPAQFEDLKQRDLELVGYLGDENIDKEDINAILIN